MRININPQFSTWPIEKLTLQELLACSPGKYGVEIGCFRGVTTHQLAEICSRSRDRHLIGIDPYNQDWADESVYHDCLQNIEPFKDYVTIIREFSNKALDNPELPDDFTDNCGFVFVDGDHSYEATLEDIQKYYEILLPHGTMAVHDYWDKEWPGVAEAVDEFVASKPGLTMRSVMYIPTQEEQRLYQHGASGLVWFCKK